MRFESYAQNQIIMALKFQKRGDVTSKADYVAILKDSEKWVPSSFLSFDDTECVLKVEKLISIEYGTRDDQVYVAFLCKDESRSWTCQLPVLYCRKVFSGKDINGRLVAGKCTGSLVTTLEDKNFGWETVSGLIGKSFKASRPDKILTEKDGKSLTHRIYRLDLLEK